ncbi:hypothetical protein Tco_1432883, partial [Tanacetum coccineum]
MTATSGDQRWPTTVKVANHREPSPDHRSTTVRPPVNHLSMVVNCQSTDGSTGQQLLRGSQMASTCHHVAP